MQPIVGRLTNVYIANGFHTHRDANKEVPYVEAVQSYCKLTQGHLVSNGHVYSAEAGQRKR